ncbi:nesprin-2 isoform X3 [Varanus komodoensis]|uniref:nesprin-2 isoform X3 n=1 Tax=Varanus komodoensis TaxID=61221 RepID=UPI001CF7CEBC|nr:nesprin-2 isoform X3 [Varanus komodoensis]
METSKISPDAEEQPSTDIEDLHYSLQAEQENTQKRTFTSWVNSQLEKHTPPSLISDLYTDIGEGHALLDLLEVLSGQQLPREKGSNTFQCRTNIENALTFLKNRSIKLINIHVTDITEGKPSIVLGLIWTIILHFHIEELAWTLAGGYSQASPDGVSAVGSSPTPSPPAERNTKAKERWKMSAKKALLLWAKEQCATHGSISIADFKSSWRNGLAFLAIIHALRPDLVDLERAKGRTNKENLKEAFQIAEKDLNIPPLLEPEDVDVISPDEKSIMTYVAQFLQYFKSLPVAEEDTQGKVGEALGWLSAQEKKLTKMLAENETAPFYTKYQEILSFMETFNEEKKAFLPLLASKRKVPELSEDYLRMREKWDSINLQMNGWKAKLDLLLPQPLDVIESWLQEVEHLLAEDLPDSQEHCKKVAVLEGKMRSIQGIRQHNLLFFQSSMECFERHLETLQSFKNRDEKGTPLVPPQKLEEMRRRFSNIQLTDFNVFVEHHHSLCTAVLEELISKLNVWRIRFGTKETVESLLSDWQDFIEERNFVGQLDAALQACKEKNKIISASNLGTDPEDANKLFKMVESQISRCKEYIYNVNETLQKVLASWATYTGNIVLLKAWLEETRKGHPKKVPPKTLAAWNSRHGSLNEAGNFLIECSSEEVGAAISGELKKLNRKWAKLIKKTQFEMKLLRKQEENAKPEPDSNGNIDSPRRVEPHLRGPPGDASGDALKMNVADAEALPVHLHADTVKPEVSLSEEAVKQDFEDAYKQLEASIVKAMQLLGQEASPGAPVSKHEEAFSVLDTCILGKFLKATEQLKDISPAHEKAVVEEKSRDVCERWEAVRHEIVSYIQLKMEIGRGKLNKTFSKLNKQLNKEEKLLSTGKTKGLLDEHEAMFSQQGGLGELNKCLQAIKTMSEKIAEDQDEPQAQIPVAEYEKRKEALQTRASAVYNALASSAGDGHSPKKGAFLLASANGEGASSLHPHDRFSPGKGSGDVSLINLELEKKLQNGGHCTEKFGRDGDLPLKRLKESYDTARDNLKLHLSTVREKIASAFTDDVKDVSCLQKKLDQLKALESEAGSSWKLFESVASELGKASGKTEESDGSGEAEEELHREWKDLQSALNKRMASLKAVLALLRPIESKWVSLCHLDEQLCTADIPRGILSKADLPFKKVKKIRTSVANCIEQCSRRGRSSPAGETVDPTDWQAAGAVMGEFRARLEELGHKMQVVEAILQDLETFLAFLKRVKRSVDACTPQSAEDVPQEVSQLKKEAKNLDERLRRVHVRLEEAEGVEKMWCQDLVAALGIKEAPAAGPAEKQEVTQSQEEEFALKNSELYKNIQDLHDKITKLGLRDPTIPAVQQRLKSLTELRQKLDRHAAEMRALNEMVGQLAKSTKARREDVRQQWRLTESLWKETKLSIAERLEHCAQVMELLKNYHSCKSCLENIILKQEHALSQQVSYMGKENLQRIIAKVNLVKQEFNSRSEDVDRINQICKNLQSHLNKMKSFEDPPFENEANAIVDRWLDINERTENYCDNLGRALALWDKLLNLSSSVDEWSNAELKNLEDGHLSEEELAELEAALRFQEKNLEEFDSKVDEIQHLLNSSEPPLELQVIRSSLLNKMELIRKQLPNRSVPIGLNGNTVELKGDLDLAKTQIGMTESLLKALSPSDTLEIFTKLEEIHQKIQQQKCHVHLLQKETGYLNPEVIELQQQLESMTDLFNSKKQIFQDHFTTLLDYQCNSFDEWFNSTRLSLEDCFDPSETKEILEEKIQRLTSFLDFDGKDSDIHEVKILLTQLNRYLPQAQVNQLSSWVRDREAALQGITSKSEARLHKLHVSLQQFARLEDDFGSLEGWLSLQEETLQESLKEKLGLENFYQLLLKQRESFDSFAWLANSLRNAGFSGDEVVLGSSQLVGRYKKLLNQVRKSLRLPQALSAEEKNFEELAQSMLCWIQRLKDSIQRLSAKETKMPAEERLCQMKEIALLKDEGDAKLQNIAALGEHLKSLDGSKNPAIQQKVSDVQNEWDCTFQLAADCLKHQESSQPQQEPDRQKVDSPTMVLWEPGNQTRDFSLAFQPGSSEEPSQFTDSAALLQETEGLTLLVNELARQHSSFGLCPGSSVTEESQRALQHLHESLCSRLQNMSQLLEGHARERRRCEELAARLRATLQEPPETAEAAQKQVQQEALCQSEGTLQEIVALVDSVRQKISPSEQACVKDKVDVPQTRHKKRLKTKHRHVEQEAENSQGNLVKQNQVSSDDGQSQKEVDETTATGKPISAGVPFAAKEISTMDILEGCKKGRRKQEKSLTMKDQMDGEAPQIFQEVLTRNEQSPRSASAESMEEPSSTFEGLKGSLIEAHNFPGSTRQSRKQLQKSGQMPADDDLLDELQQRQPSYQKKLPATWGWSEMPQSTGPLMNGKGTDPVLSSITHPLPESKGPEVETVSQKGLLPSEDQAILEYAEVEKKINEMKVWAAELDIVLLNDQLREIENLSTLLEKHEAKAFPSKQGEHLAAAEESKRDLADAPRVAPPGWDTLMQDLTAVKEAKQAQVRSLKSYQEGLAAVQSALKHLSSEKENIKIRGPIEDAALLENIKKCLASVEKEKWLLNTLKSEQESLSRPLTWMDKELTQSQVNQAEQWWRQLEESLQRSQFRVAAEADEFKHFMGKAEDLQRLLQKQYRLQTGLDSPDGEDPLHSSLMATDLQALKHSVSLLKRGAEVWMKRIWRDPGKKALESMINDLLNQVEELEQLTPREGAPIPAHPRAYEITKKVEEAILWARVSVLHLDEAVALFPEDVASQIESCKALIRATEEKKPVLVRLAEEVQSIAPQLASQEASSLTLLLRKLQTHYQGLVRKLVQKMQQLEPQLGKRSELFAEMEKVETQLQKAEQAATLEAGKTSLKSELDHWRASMEKIPKEMEDLEDLVDASCREPAERLNIFEQLFLKDCLSSLKNRAKRACRLMQIKYGAAQNKLDACEKLSEKMAALQQDLSCLQAKGLELDPEALLPTDEGVKKKLNLLQERALRIQSDLSQLGRYKEIWDCLGLKWDASHLDELQSQFCKMKNNLEQMLKRFDHFCAEGERYQTALDGLLTMVDNIQKDWDAWKDGSASPSETCLVSGKVLSWRVKHARYLTEEVLRLLDKNESFNTSLKEAKLRQIKSLEAKIDELSGKIQSNILASQEKCRSEQGLQSELDQSLRALQQIKSELQQPVLLDLDSQSISHEKLYCKVLEDAVKAESRIAEHLIDKERELPAPEGLAKEAEALKNLKKQLKADLAARQSTLDEACRTVKLYTEAVQKAAGLLRQCEARLPTAPFDLDKLEDGSGHLFQKKQEEFETAKAEGEALISALQKKMKAKARLQPEKALNDLVARNLVVREQERKSRSAMQRYLAKYHSFKKSKEVIRTNLNNVEKVLWKSFYRTPVSYKEALELSEQSKLLVSQLVSTEQDLMKLRQDSGQLSSVCKEGVRTWIVTLVSTLWLKWVYLLNAAKEWEGKCDEQSQEWKAVNEEMEREAIILDNFLEELPESPREKERATKEELGEFLEAANYYKESVDAEKLLLHVISHRLRSILNVPECPPEKGGNIPVVCEIQTMQDRITEICQKVQKQKDAVQSEIAERAKVNEEISAVKNSLLETMLLLPGTALEGKAADLEEIQRAIDCQKQTLDQIMEKLRIKYAEMYTIVPLEIERHLDDCKETLQNLEEKVSTELMKTSPHYTTDKKIEDINKGLQAIESMLQQKSENIDKAKEIQKRIWDLLDLWHYKMNELDSDVQDIVEQDPCQAQELMDRLMIPLQQYQQVSQCAERRTANLNRAASKIEECDELLKCFRFWLENTNRLLSEQGQSDSAKVLNKHASALQMAFEDSEQKQHILDAIYPELEELSTLIETGKMIQELNEVNEQVKASQQKIMEVLPHIQQLADDVEAVESEVKAMEKNVEKIKSILSPSEDTLDFSPEEHLKHGQVILAHIHPMQKTLADLQRFKETLRLPGMKPQPLSVFQRTKQLLKELKTLERITVEQNALLEPIVKEMGESEQEIDFLKQRLFPKSDSDDLSTENPWPDQAASQPEGKEMEKIKERLAFLCQRKDDLLTTMKNSLVKLHQRQEGPEPEDEALESQVVEESRSGGDWQPKKRGSLSLLPSLVEEAEDSSLHNEEVGAHVRKAVCDKPGQQLALSSPQKAEHNEELLGFWSGGRPPVGATNPAQGLWGAQGDSEAAAGPGPGPTQVLHACQARLAELELWLDRARESLGSEAHTRQMQQTVEEHLALCQVMLSEIEQKVVCLLEDCKDRPASDGPGLQQEAESLSAKLKDVRCNLEKVQGMLQDKHSEGQLISEEKLSEKAPPAPHFDLSNVFPPITSDRLLPSRLNGLQQQQDLLLKLSEQSNLIDFIEVYVEKTQPPPGERPLLGSQASHEMPSSGNASLVESLKDQTGDKWQYLREELLLKTSPPHGHLAEPQISTKINILPKGAPPSVRTPTVEELKTYTAQLGSLSQEASVQKQENATGEISFSLDQKLFELLLAISRCLNNMEQMLSTCVLTSEEAPMQQALYETLSAELQKLHGYIGDKKDDLLKSISSAGRNPQRFSQCFNDLQAWLQLTQAAADSRSKSMKTELDHYSDYQNEIRLLCDALTEKKSTLQQPFCATSRHNASEQLQEMKSCELELQNFEMRTAKLRDYGERFHLPVALIQEVYKLEDMLDELWESLREKQRELGAPFVNEKEYDTLLRGLVELVDLGQGKIAQVSKLRATDRPNLQFHLENHKSFFRNLNTHMLLVQMSSKKVAHCILQKREKSWNDLVEKIKTLEEEAVQHGAYLEKLLQDWIEFDENHAAFYQKMEALSSTVPSVSLVEETEERLMERSQLLQQIKRNLEEEEAQFHQIVKDGKNLMELVNCPDPQSQVKKLEEQWAAASQKVDHELQRLESSLKLFCSYRRDSKELDDWLESTQPRVKSWTEQSLDASQDLNTVRNNIQGLLEFHKEVDEKSSLKSSVLSTGNQLLVVKASDAAVLRSSLTEYEQKWADLIAQLPSIQEKFHQLLMAKLPSHEAIAELIAWMSHVDQQRENEAPVSLQSPASQVNGLLKKYKAYLMEMNFKQWVVDHVNQSLLQLTTCDVESKRYERTAFAELLGEMNLKWHRLQGALHGKEKELECILEAVTENESRAQSLSRWLEAQSRRLSQVEKPSSSILAEDTARECSVLENQLAIKAKEVDQLKQNHTALDYGAEAPEGSAKRAHDLDEMRTSAENQVAQLKTSAGAALESWKVYDAAWCEVSLMLAHASYLVEHSRPPVMTFEMLKNQMEKLQALQDKAESNEKTWAGLQAAAGNLMKLCSPLFSKIIEKKHKEARTRWTLVNREIEDQLQKTQTALHLWEPYTELHAEVTAKLDKHEEQCCSLQVARTPTGCTVDFLKRKIQEVKNMQLGLQNIKESILQASELADKIAQLCEPSAQPLLLEKHHLLQRVSRLEKMLQMKADELQFGLSQLEGFEKCLEKLENHVKNCTEVLDNLNQEEKDPDLLMSQMLSLTALSPEMEALNEVSFRLPLGDFTAERLQRLNWQWTQKSAALLEQCSELQDVQSDDKKFLQRCQNWVQFLERMKEGLKEKVAGTLDKLCEQQREYEMLQAEMSVNQQIFNAIMSKALHTLESGGGENRTEFISKLTLLKGQWQSVVRRAQQRKSEIDGLVKQWQNFATSLKDLTKFLADTNSFLAAVKKQDKYSLRQLRNVHLDFKNKQILLQRWRTRYALALDTGDKLLGVAAPEAKAAMELEMSQLRENWDNTQRQVEDIAKQLQDTLQAWESCEQKAEELGHRLHEQKASIHESLPVLDDELQGAKEHIKELEKSLATWNQSAQALGTAQADLAAFILAEDVMVLKEQVEHLHRQWEELCVRVSLRKQEIEDRLNAWMVFNEKNKELCAWLVQMESKVLQSVDVSIEDMIDKLQKDCMEEIHLFSENKLVHFKQMGDQLIKASSKSRVAEIDEKLNKINDRWQHLFDVIGGRVKKLKETFAFIQQLDKNMSSLRTWLARIESELSKPVVYDICDDQEIQKRLAEQQDLQRDIEEHSAGVESVFNICDVLLHDSDACANETECDSIQQTTRSLDRRWRNICAMSMERRMKIEETWRLWQKFLDDYSRFEDWLKTAERTAAYPNSSEVSYTNAKEELKKFEAFQRQIHERLTQLELINKQYRRLARENRTDSASKLKQMAHEGNQRWDNLQKRVAAVLRRLRHFTCQWEEFVGKKDSILVWLTEMDLQLTNVEHFSESNFDDKMRQLNGFQQEITLNINKIDQLIEFGEYLIQRSEPSDAVVIEEELEELHKYCQEVFGRVFRFHQRLSSWHPGLEDEKETSENEGDTEDTQGMQNDSWHKKALQEVPPSQQSLCHLMPPTVGHERSGCETPVSIDSIPLEWDHTGDVGGSSSPEDEDEEPYYSALSGKSASETHTWHSPESPACRKHPYSQGEMVRSVLLNSPETSTPYKAAYARQLSTGSTGSMKGISGISPSGESRDSESFVGVMAVDKQPGPVERWELIQAQDLSKKLRLKQNLQQWQQLDSDLTNINAWLDKMEKELEELQEAGPATSIQVIEQGVKKLKSMLKAFDNYKALVLSVNLTSKDFKQADNTRSKELQNRLRQVNLRWEKANHLNRNWGKSLQAALMNCQDFHEQNQKLLLWLAGAETRRHQAQVKDPNADPHAIQESWTELMQLEKELLEQQPQVNAVQEISTYLLAKSDEGEYIEAAEKVHVIGKKLKQLLEDVSRDLKASRGSQDISTLLPHVDELDSGNYHQLPAKPSIYKNKVDGEKALQIKSSRNMRAEVRQEAGPAAPKSRCFFYRVLRAALPLQLLFLLLLLLASMVPSSEEDYSCTQANNYARSFYPMLRYTNGPPPT